VVAHLYVAPHQRRRGLGRALLDHALADGAARGAEIAWLEASNVNHPAITAYRRLGFYLCGLDATLYAGTPGHDEIALFFACPLQR
jgi:ribosomal protein S18 acetylase RimI-like enzyme